MKQTLYKVSFFVLGSPGVEEPIKTELDHVFQTASLLTFPKGTYADVEVKAVETTEVLCDCGTPLSDGRWTKPVLDPDGTLHPMVRQLCCKACAS